MDVGRGREGGWELEDEKLREVTGELIAVAGVYMCVCVFICVYVCVCVCMCACI